MMYNVKISKSSAGSSTARQPIQKASGWIGPHPPTRPEPRHNRPRYVRFVELPTPPNRRVYGGHTCSLLAAAEALRALLATLACVSRPASCTAPYMYFVGSLPCRRRTEPNWELGRLYHALPCSMLRDPPNLSPPPGPCRERSRATEKSLSISTLTPTPNLQTPTPNPNPNAGVSSKL